MNWRDKPMARFFSISRWALPLALVGSVLLFGSVSVEAKSKKSKPSPTPDATPTPSETPADKGIDIPIPVGHSASGVRIPLYGPEGRLQMIFESEIAFRLDKQQLRLTHLKIETYDETDGKPEMFIDMPLSIFDLKTRIFSSTVPVTIRRTDFEVTGENMTFNTETRQGKFIGPVRMLIFKNNDEVEPPKENATRE